jgi:hypothetical protein
MMDNLTEIGRNACRGGGTKQIDIRAAALNSEPDSTIGAVS